jgi:hypothetical protein
MRALIALYLMIGIVLLLIGFFATGPCPDKNTEIVSDVVFVLGWPVYLYDDVVTGTLTPPAWLHRQACEGGLRTIQKTELAR